LEHAQAGAGNSIFRKKLMDSETKAGLRERGRDAFYGGGIAD